MTHRTSAQCRTNSSTSARSVQGPRRTRLKHTVVLSLIRTSPGHRETIRIRGLHIRHITIRLIIITKDMKMMRHLMMMILRRRMRIWLIIGIM